MEKPNFYGIMPADVRYDRNLKPMEKILYTEITALTNSKGYCFATNSYFAELYEVHKNTVGTWISNLEKQGYIKTVLIYKKGTKEIMERRIYINQKNVIPINEKIDTPINEKVDTYQRKDCDPINEKVEDNNTRLILNNNNYIYSSDEFVEILTEYIQMRKKKKKEMTERAIRRLLKKIESITDGINEEKAIELLEIATDNQWQDVYDNVKKQNENNKNDKKTENNYGKSVVKERPKVTAEGLKKYFGGA